MSNIEQNDIDIAYQRHRTIVHGIEVKFRLRRHQILNKAFSYVKLLMKLSGINSYLFEPPKKTSKVTCTIVSVL